ncbi:unnamed protein product [Somion occarium]|uniref:F-box domain-containing protein n=1 Tax=Somion occarium TaxID=3059160 RepID=A0ABP1DI31_9APHY
MPWVSSLNSTAPKELMADLKGSLAPSTSFTVDREWPLNGLPDDLLLLILSFTEVMDIIRLRQTCKRMYKLTKLRWVWSTAIRRLVNEKRLTVPALNHDTKAFSVKHFETRAVHAVKFHENWHSPQPSPRHRIRIQTLDSAIKKVFFLPGRKGEILVTVTNRTIACWEVPLMGSEGFCIAKLVSPADIYDVVINEVPTHDTQIVFNHRAPPGSSDCTVITCHLDEFHGRIVMLRRFSMPYGVGFSLYTLRGNWLVSGSMPYVVNVVAEDKPAMPLSNLEDDTILAVKLVGKYAFIVATKNFQLTQFESNNGEKPSVKILLGGTFRSPLRGATIWAQRTTDVKGPNNSMAEAVSLVLRCADDGFETIKQLDWLYDPNHKSSPSRVPFLPPKTYTRTMMTAPSSCNLVVGMNGKGVFFETKTITTSTRSSYTARCIGGFELVRTEGRPVQRGKLESGSPSKIWHPPCGPPNFVECKKEIYSRRCDMGEILYRRYSLTSVALEDMVGRIAVGDRNGVVEVLEYA